MSDSYPPGYEGYEEPTELEHAHASGKVEGWNAALEHVLAEAEKQTLSICKRDVLIFDDLKRIIEEARK